MSKSTFGLTLYTTRRKSLTRLNFCLSENWWDFNNPCTQSAVEQGNVVFPHPYNANMYLTCDLTGRVYIVVCPQGTLFEQDSLQCGSGGPSTGNRTEQVEINPCTAEQLFQGNFFFPYLGDHHKYSCRSLFFFGGGEFLKDFIYLVLWLMINDVLNNIHVYYASHHYVGRKSGCCKTRIA